MNVCDKEVRKSSNITRLLPKSFSYLDRCDNRWRLSSTEQRTLVFFRIMESGS